MVSEKKVCLNILMAFKYEQPWQKGQRLTLTLGTYPQPLSHWDIYMSILEGRMYHDFGLNSNVIEKSTYHFN